MKKLLLYTLILLAFLPGFSQSLELYYEDELLENEAVLMVATHPDSLAITLHGIEVKNTSAAALTINCIRENVDTIPGTLNYFCWGLCYGPPTDTSFVPVTIEAASTTFEFEGDYMHNGNTGVSTIKYTFYDLDNPDDRISVIVKYNVTTALNVPKKKELVALSNIYPNPANVEANIDYTLSASQGKTEISLFNLLGAKVKTYDLNKNEGTLTLNTSDLKEGIYFYSLLINNESIITQKLIIKH